MRDVYETKNIVNSIENPPFEITGYYLKPRNGITRVYIITEVDEFI